MPLSRRRVGAGLAAAFAAPLAGCSPAASGPPPPRGTAADVRRTGWYPALASRAVLAAAGIEAPPIGHAFTSHRVIYGSQTSGRPVRVSALVSVPDVARPRGVVLWMHGTNPDRGAAVSTPTLQEGVAVSAIFAGGGYVVVAPDLVGQGVSTAPQAYLYNPSTIDVTVDLLSLVRRGLDGVLPAGERRLFITGFSQGGHDAAVIHRALEANPAHGFRPVATGAVAGAYDLAGLSIPFALQGRSGGDTVYLGLVGQSWATYTGRELTSVFTDPAAAKVRATLDGAHAALIDKQLPRNPRALFRPEVLSAVAQGGGHWFVDAARANSAHDWAPRAPYRAYYGDRDVDVSPQDTIRFAAASRVLGGAVTAVPVGPYDHFGSVVKSAPLIRRWFDELAGA